MDGELSESEARFLVRRLSHDPQLKGQWADWHRTRAAINGGVKYELGDLCSRVSSALESEPSVVAPAAATSPRPWLKPLAGLSVAAAVAVAGGDGEQSVCRLSEYVLQRYEWRSAFGG